MILIVAAVCTKAVETIVSRQLFDMTKARIEGLLAAFPKLMTAGKQHTFVETDSVRYVYTPLEKLYMLLITTKENNILEDLEMDGSGRPYGGGSFEGFGSSFSGGGFSNHSSISASTIGIGEIKPVAPAAKPAAPRNALRLGGKNRDVDTFVDQLKSEGEKVVANPTPATVPSVAKVKPVSDVPMDEVHLRMKDKIVGRVGRDGGLQAIELSGLLILRISDEKYGRIKLPWDA